MSRQVYSDEDRRELDKYNKHIGVSSKKHFCVFRVGRKMKTLGQIQAFEKHMERQCEVKNADKEKTKYNRRLIGNQNLAEEVKKKLYGVKIRSNANICRDLVLTSNKDFFRFLSDEDKKIWVSENIKFLEQEFGDNCIYACLHLDETTPHIHALILPLFYNENKNRNELRSNMYFDGAEKLKDYQTKYADHMSKRFNNLIRGIRGSKAEHIDIKTYYSMINKSLDIKDDKQILAYAKNNYLTEKRLKALEKTLIKYNEDDNKEKLINKIEKLNKNSKIYKKVIKAMSKKYNIKEREIISMIDESENEKER